MTSKYPTIFLFGEITPGKITILLKNIETLSKKNDTIGIRFDTPGGNLKGFHLTEKIFPQFKDQGITFVGEAGRVGSAGLVSYLVCDKRVV